MATISSQPDFAEINVALGRSASAALSLNDSEVRLLAQKPSGAISLGDCIGRSVSSHTLTSANTFASNYGFDDLSGYVSPISIGGYNVDYFVDEGANNRFSFSLATSGLPSTFWYAITINGQTLYRSSFSYLSSPATWIRSSFNLGLGVGSYPFKIFR
jgi:hypothetical protein